MAKCPAHKDRRASLSVRELDDGRVLLHCFAQCDVASVVAALGLQMEDLFPPREVTAGGRPPERRPYGVRDVVNALAAELGVAWVILADLAAGKDINPADRRRGAVARDRCAMLIEELRHAR
jgi:hypothetical protein